MHAKLALTLVLGTIILSGASAQTIVYNNFGPGFSYDADQGYQESGPSAVGPITPTSSIGVLFQPLTSGKLFDITLAMSHTSGTNNAHFFLKEANPLPAPGLGSGPLSNPDLETWTISNLQDYPTGSLQTLTSVNAPYLNASKFYFFFGKETGDQYNGWNLNNQGVTGNLIKSSDNTNYKVLSSTLTTPVLQVRTEASAAVTPELPGGMLLLPALLPVALIARRKRKG